MKFVNRLVVNEANVLHELAHLCAAHIVHNCIELAVDNLSVPVERIVVKIYKFFHSHTVRVTQLKEFCDFVDVEYQRILQHGNTRFLSLLSALQRVIEMFKG